MCSVESDVRDFDPVKAIRDQAASALSKKFLIEIENDISKLPPHLHLRTRLLIAAERARHRVAETVDPEKVIIAQEEYVQALRNVRLEQCTVAEAFIYELSESYRHYPQDLLMAIAPVIQEVIAPIVDRIEERLSLLETAMIGLMSQRGQR